MAETTHRQAKNSSFCLSIGNPEKCNDVIWTFNETVIVFNQQLKSNDTTRVDYKSSSHSVCINGLTESDAGIYVIDNMCGSKKVIETHILHVLGKSSVFSRCMVVVVGGLHLCCRGSISQPVREA